MPLRPFAEAVSGVLAMMDGASLVVEPGRAVVDPAVQLLATVVATKQTPAGPAVVTDAGVNLLSNMSRTSPRPIAAVDVPGAPVSTAVARMAPVALSTRSSSRS